MHNFGESKLLSAEDTKRVTRWCGTSVELHDIRPNSAPTEGELLPISEVFSRIRCLEGEVHPHLGYMQERNRAAKLHQMICEKLGYCSYEDDGTYPDILNQLIEIKLQTSPTIDLGLHSPDDHTVLFAFAEQEFRSKDIRYAIIDAFVESDNVKIQYIYVVNWRDFADHFPLFGGKVQNAKLQIPLPSDFFS